MTAFRLRMSLHQLSMPLPQPVGVFAAGRMPIPLLCDSKCLAMGLSFSWKGKGTTGILPGMAVPVSEFWPSDHDRRQAPLGPDCAQPLLANMLALLT
jgi:hypothetical protein